MRLFSIILMISLSISVYCQQRDWTTTIGTQGFDYGKLIGVDINGNCYLAGKISDNFNSEKGFCKKYDQNGNEIWNKEILSSTGDEDFHFQGILNHDKKVYLLLENL